MEKCTAIPDDQQKTHKFQENFEVLMGCIRQNLYTSKVYLKTKNKIPPSKHSFSQNSSGFCSFPLQ